MEEYRIKYAYCLHHEILNNISNREMTKKMIEELYEIVIKTESTLNDEHYHDLLLIYLVFFLLNDNRKNEIEKLIKSFFKLHRMNEKGQKNELSIEEIFRASVETLEIVKHRYLIETLYSYCFTEKDVFDKEVNTEIVHLVSAYFQHRRNPKDLFYTDHTYICDYIALQSERKKYLKQTDNTFEEYQVYFENPYCNLGKIHGLSNKDEIKELEEKLWSEAYFNAKVLLETTKIKYELRVIYPKEEFLEVDRERYEFERQLYNRVLFNESLRYESSKLIQPLYREPEDYLHESIKLLEKGVTLSKAIYAALYLASKEIFFSDFQILFKIETEQNKNYKKAMLGIMQKTLSSSILFSDYAKDILKGRKCDLTTDKNKRQAEEFFEEMIYKPSISEIDESPTELSNAQKQFIRGFLFICMWEKASYKKDSLKNIDKDLFEMNNIKDKSQDGFFYERLHQLFVETAIDALPELLQETSRLFGMNEKGFDYSFLKLEKTISNTNDICTLLFNLSRMKRESMPALLSTLNLLREKQKEKLPITKNGKFRINNQKRLKKYDEGFTISLFESTLEPLQKMRPLLENSDLDNTYIYTKKTVKFVCETDKEYTDKTDGYNKFTSLKKGLDSIYLYKIRNQQTHFCLDDNVAFLLKSSNCKILIQTLIEAHKKYEAEGSKVLNFWNKKGTLSMVRSAPFRLIGPTFVSKLIKNLIEVIYIIVATKNKEKITISDLCEKEITSLENALFEIEKYAINTTEIEEAKRLLYKKYGDSESIISPKADEREKELLPYLENIEEILLAVLNFLFTTDVLEYESKVQYDDFLETYHAESAYYMLYLSQFFIDGFLSTS